MFWLALLFLAIAGFDKPRKALVAKFSSATDGLLKVLMGFGIFMVLVFGFAGVGNRINFFVALIPALFTWLGLIAAIEMGGRQTKYGEDDPAEFVEVDKRWREEHAKRVSVSREDPWGLLVQNKEPEAEKPRTPKPKVDEGKQYLPAHVGVLGSPPVRVTALDDALSLEGDDEEEDVARRDLLAVIQEAALAREAEGSEPGDLYPVYIPKSGLAPVSSMFMRTAEPVRHGNDTLSQQEVTEPEPVVEPPVAEAVEAEPVELEEVDQVSTPEHEQEQVAVEEPEPEQVAAEEPEVVEEPEAEEAVAHHVPILEPPTQLGAETTIGDTELETAHALDVDTHIAKDKENLAAETKTAAPGKYVYKPQMVKSLFSKDD